MRLPVPSTHAAARYLQAGRVKAKDLCSRAGLAGRRWAGNLENNLQEAESYGLWRFWMSHCAAPFFGLARQQFSHRENARVLGYRFAFRNYHPLRWWVGLCGGLS